MADNRKPGASREGPRAIPEDRWAESASAERQQDTLVEEGIPSRDAPPDLQRDVDDGYTPEMRRALDDQDARVSEQARVGPRKVTDPEQPT